MVQVTLQVLEGLERGRLYTDLPTPITIGREDDNVVRLNDDRVSRFHAKIQEDHDRVILTDLDSTNGTRVNGHPVQMRILQIGDQLTIGRCLLVYGSPEEIAARAAEMSDSGRIESPPDGWTLGGEAAEEAPENEFGGAFDAVVEGTRGAYEELFPDGPPQMPHGLGPAQRAELSDFLAYLHDQLRSVLISSSEASDSIDQEFVTMQLDWLAWQHLLKLEMDLAVALRRLADPDS